ncbi:hypothetical protein [Flammeovirga agarivorans]|uniref:Uncharacterized protein n=1 Tax=Flammeovirga agarivorans TaxID=2726742 RepID=A0A7X8XZ51_9BACT|nr:hypothetical protein [Flammeovirga agarivorans]NLR94846.1 hypothetical protein [Flammeovirga agarivorans]
MYLKSIYRESEYELEVYVPKLNVPANISVFNRNFILRETVGEFIELPPANTLIIQEGAVHVLGKLESKKATITDFIAHRKPTSKFRRLKDEVVMLAMKKGVELSEVMPFVNLVSS